MFAIASLLLLSLLLVSPPSPWVAVQAHGVPTPEMIQATSLDEFNRLLQEQRNGPPPQFRRTRQQRQLQVSQPLLANAFNNVPGFYHGVASGDPLPNAVIVWTRYTPVSASDTVSLELRMAAINTTAIPLNDHLDPTKNPNLKRSIITVTSASDWIAKVDVTGLIAGTKYVYAFSDGTVTSDVGTTRTAPALTEDTAQMTYAVFSCSNFGNGWFHPYDVASTIKDLDFWVHVGDYVYEYGSYSTYASDSATRKSQILPLWEMVTVQDYRLRYATYHRDEGLRNLRRRAPLIAVWDDHELTNNAYGRGTLNNTGAENHQPTCPVNSSANDTAKESAKCDRDEGDVIIRYRNAAQAYMEWLPLRRGPGTMGVVTTTSITQVIEWGRLATVTGFDTRISYRSREPTLRSNFNFFAAAFAATNISLYNEAPLNATFRTAADSLRAEINNPSYAMIGDNINILKDSFSASKAAGKPWQIWAGATMMATHIGADLSIAHTLVNSTVAPIVKNYTDGVLASASGAFARALYAMAQSKSPWNGDDFNGFGVERAAILKVMKDNANNAIILGGDLHDSWAWILNEDGNITGTPVAVNLGVQGTSSPGFGAALYPLLRGLEPVLGSTDAVYNLSNALWAPQNPSLVYADTQYKGFFAVKATKTTHTTEYFHTRANTMLSDFATARAASGRITGSFLCGASLVTTAGQKGSLVRQSRCSAIEYDTTRPAEWNIPFPKVSDAEGVTKLSNCNMDSCKFDVDTCTFRNITKMQLVNPSTTPPQLVDIVSDPNTPLVVDLTKYASCKLNIAAFAKREPAGCLQSNIQCVKLQLGSTTQLETTSPYALYGKDGTAYKSGTPKGGKQTLRVCTHNDTACVSEPSGCQQVNVDVRGLAVSKYQLISTVNDKVLANINPGSSRTICRPRRGKIQVVAIAEGCVEKVKVKVSPAAGRQNSGSDEVTATKAPFQLYGSGDGGRFRLDRTYTLTAIPNDDTNMTITSTFKLRRCGIF